ncbi:MAG: cytidine/deoxycytidylate deaminase family protein [Patescibacteria group bacterium]|nr:cytidine/deoxycytidylate deaminase family protein [Patescibacteria group bacterium]
MIRPTWDDYFFGIMQSVASRATCDRGRSGAVIVKNKQILVTGYVGSPKGLPHCDDVGHEFKDTIHEDGHVSKHCVRTIHAEQNAICQAAKCGIAVEGATLYCRMTPCYTCAKIIINAGIARVAVLKDYHAGADSRRIFKEAGIQFDIMDDSFEPYDDQAGTFGRIEEPTAATKDTAEVLRES